MKNKLIYMMMVFAFGLIISVQIFYQHTNAKDKKLWEYKKVYASVETEFEEINKAGNEGWELIAVQQITEIRGYYIFKRPKE